MARKTYRASIRRHLGRAEATDVVAFKLRELQAGGWGGDVTVDPEEDQSVEISFTTAFARAIQAGLTPGRGATLRLIEHGDEDTPDNMLRVWPSVVVRVKAQIHSNLEALTSRVAYKVRVVDPLTYLSDTPIWGAFLNAAPADILGGALSLAAGGDGVPTRQPVLPGMPDVRVAQRLRSDLDEIPYAIACGEPLGLWLQRIFARLGVRLEMEVSADGEVVMNLRDDDIDSEDNLAIEFEGAGQFSATNAHLAKGAALSTWPVPMDRTVLLDNLVTGDARQLGFPGDGAVRDVYVAAGLDPTEAERRAGFLPDAWLLAEVFLKISTRQSQARPGRVFEFVNQSVDDQHVWQIADVTHDFDIDRYENTAYLQKGVLAWRPSPPRDDGPLVVSGVIDDGSSERGEPVPRDRLGRIPVRLSVLPSLTGDDEDLLGALGASGTSGATGTTGAAGTSSASGSAGVSGASGTTASIVVIRLPVADLMGGGLHGFLPAHRQGDVCRVLVHQPLLAEIQGFCYRDDRRIGIDQTDVSTGLVAHRGSAGWAGMLFRPKEELEEEYGESDN